jgi:tetratricopeptide (TPR) repeat protein
VLLGRMAVCHKQLHQWNKAVACNKEAVELAHNLFSINHPFYAAALTNLAYLFDELKQYEEAIPRYEEGLIIYQRMYGHEHTVSLRTRSATQSCQNRCGPRTLHVQPVRQDQGGVVYWMPPCMVLRQGVPAAALGHAQAALTKIKRCSRCLKAKYYGTECSRAHWSEHKQDCIAAVKLANLCAGISRASPNNLKEPVQGLRGNSRVFGYGKDSLVFEVPPFPRFL